MARSKKRSRRPFRSHQHTQVAAIEKLETRQLLTGQVTATVSDGNLTITGDAEANELELTYFKGDVSIRSRSGTKINGKTGRTILFAGTDTVPGNVTVKLADGKDKFIVSRDIAIEGNLFFAGGIANDTFGMIGARVNGNLKVVMGTGRDGVSIDDSYVGGTEAIIRGNNGKDSFHLDSSRFVPQLDVETGKGDDDLTMHLVRTDGDANIETGDQNDHVSIVSGRFKAGLRVVTSKGEDTVRMLDTRVATNTQFGLGADNDQLALGATGQRNIFVGNFTANGSGGSDTYEQRNNIFKGSRTVERFDEGEIDASGLQQAIARTSAVDDVVKDLFLYRVQTLAAATGVETAGGFITKSETPTVTGMTTNDALVEVDLDDDGEFDDGSVQADEFGLYEISVTVPEGESTVKFRSTDAAGTQQAFDLMVHRAVGTVVRFNTSLGFFDAELLDEDAPLTVANYLAYTDGDSNAIIHRSAKFQSGGDFVIQGGGFQVVDGQRSAIDTNDPVENEFNPANSNLRGTISTALQANSPDSATNQWFVNLADNTFLDNAQHVVFGRVIGTGMDVADAIADLPRFNLGGVYSEAPLRDYEFFANEITGTVSVTQGSFTMTGEGTLFTQELEVGQPIQVRENGVSAGTFQIAEITSDTELTLSSVPGQTVTDAELRYYIPPADEHYIFSDIEELLIPS